MKLTMISIATCLAFTAPAHALDYECSPYGTGCVPAQSRSIYEPPSTSTYYPPRRVEPRGCPLDGPGAWGCRAHDQRRERRDR